MYDIQIFDGIHSSVEYITTLQDFGTIEEHLRQFPQLRVAVVHQNGLLLASSVGPSVRLVADPRGGAGSQLWGPDHPSINVRDAVRLRLEGRTEGLVNSVPVVLKSAGIASLNGPDGPAELLIAMDTSKLAPTNEYSDTKVCSEPPYFFLPPQVLPWCQ